jgi:tRNA(His) 5'-end guanylyltransferase
MTKLEATKMWRKQLRWHSQDLWLPLLLSLWILRHCGLNSKEVKHSLQGTKVISLETLVSS